MEKRVLIVDDDIKIGQELESFLSQYGMKCHFCSQSNEAEKAIHNFQPDIVLLDIMMPELDGMELCKKIRLKSHIPIIFLSARGDVTDRIVGLEVGADDFLPKPFEPRELVARIESILRRSSGGKSSKTLVFNELSLDKNLRQVSQNNKTIDLTTMEYELLLLFAENNQKKFTRDDIMNHLKGIDDNVYSRSVDILVSRLRQKLGDEEKKLIETVWGTGYLFNAHESKTH